MAYYSHGITVVLITQKEKQMDTIPVNLAEALLEDGGEFSIKDVFHLVVDNPGGKYCPAIVDRNPPVMILTSDRTLIRVVQGHLPSIIPSMIRSLPMVTDHEIAYQVPTKGEKYQEMIWFPLLTWERFRKLVNEDEPPFVWPTGFDV